MLGKYKAKGLDYHYQQINKSSLFNFNAFLLAGHQNHIGLIIKNIKKHFRKTKTLQISDLGCGNEQPTIHWDGEQSRDFNYIDNVVEANILAMKAKKAQGEVVNVCNGEQFSVNQLFRLINKILGKNIKAKKGPKRQGDMRSTLGNPALAEKILGFKAKINFEEGLKKTIEWFRNHHAGKV